MAMDQLEVAGQQVRAYVADGTGADAPGVVVFHAWWGLNDDVTAFADRLADAGFSVIAPDLYNGAVTAEVDEAKRLTGTVDEEHGNEIALAAFERLARRPGASAIGAVGFSFGAHWAVWTPTQEGAEGRSSTTARLAGRYSRGRVGPSSGTSRRTTRSRARTTSLPSRTVCVRAAANRRSTSIRARATGSRSRLATPTAPRPRTWHSSARSSSCAVLDMRVPRF